MKIKPKNRHQWLRLITGIANECELSAKQVVAFEYVLREHLENSEGLEIVNDFDSTWRRWVATQTPDFIVLHSKSATQAPAAECVKRKKQKKNHLRAK